MGSFGGWMKEPQTVTRIIVPGVRRSSSKVGVYMTQEAYETGTITIKRHDKDAIEISEDGVITILDADLVVIMEPTPEMATGGVQFPDARTTDKALVTEKVGPGNDENFCVDQIAGPIKPDGGTSSLPVDKNDDVSHS